MCFTLAIEMEVIDSCAKSNGACDQECRDSPSGPICSCLHGYILQLDGNSCRGTLILLAQLNCMALQIGYN